MRSNSAMSAFLGVMLMLGLLAVPLAAQDPVFLANLEKQLAADKREDGRSAMAFCTSPGFKALKCGFASRDEESATIKKQCPGCGTLYFDMPGNLPDTVAGVDRYNTWGIRLVSLACQGPVVIRSVFKILEQPTVHKASGLDGTNCTHTSMVHVDDRLVSAGGTASPIVRCELELPSTGGDEVQRALKARETKCWLCDRCGQGSGCPNQNNTWYSDSYTTVARGCAIDPMKGYTYHRAGININPFTKILLAKFEVCNDQGCFDPKAEAEKQKAAKPCLKGKCA